MMRSSSFIGALAAILLADRRSLVKPTGCFSYDPGVTPRSHSPGWTAAQVKRMSRKRKNQQRHKRACRRGS